MSARKAKPNPAMKLIVVSNQSSLRLCSFPPRVSSRCDSPPPLPERHFPTQKNGVRLSHAVFLLSKRGIIAGLGLSLGCTRFFRRQMFRARSPRSRCFQTHTRTHTHTHTHTQEQKARYSLIKCCVGSVCRQCHDVRLTTGFCAFCCALLSGLCILVELTLRAFWVFVCLFVCFLVLLAQYLFYSS